MSLHQEYLTSNSAVAHPFVEDARGLDRGSGGFPLDVVVDALFSVPAAFAGLGRHLHLIGYTVDAEARVLTFYVGDGTGDLLAFAVDLNQASGAWTVASADHQFPTYYMSGTLVFDNAALTRLLDAAVAGGYSEQEYGTLLPFETSTQITDSPGVKSLDIYNSGPYGSGESVDGAVQLCSGYNINITHQGFDNGVALVRIDAGPGLGRGRLPCDEETFDVSDGPPGLVPLHGDITIEGDRCYNIVPARITGDQWLLQIQGRCQSCCTCDDYKDAAVWQKELSQRLNAVKQLLDDSRGLYEDGITEFNTDIVPSLGAVEVTAAGIRGMANVVDNHRGSPNWVRVQLTIKNGRRNAIVFNSWSLAFTRPAGATITFKDYVCASTTLSQRVPYATPVAVSVPAGTTLVMTILATCPAAKWVLDPVWEGTGTVIFTDAVTNQQTTMTANVVMQ